MGARRHNASAWHGSGHGVPIPRVAAIERRQVVEHGLFHAGRGSGDVPAWASDRSSVG